MHPGSSLPGQKSERGRWSCPPRSSPSKQYIAQCFEAQVTSRDLLLGMSYWRGPSGVRGCTYVCTIRDGNALFFLSFFLFSFLLLLLALRQHGPRLALTLTEMRTPLVDDRLALAPLARPPRSWPAAKSAAEQLPSPVS